MTFWVFFSFREYEQVHFGESSDGTNRVYLRRGFQKFEVKMTCFHLTRAVLCLFHVGFSGRLPSYS